MRIVIAGSSGLIGTALVAHLRAEGHSVQRLVRRSASAPDEIAWDPERGTLAPDDIRGTDAVVNLCGVGIAGKRWTGAYKQAIRDSRVEPTETIAAAVAGADVPVLVNAGAVGYYGDTGGRVVDETASAGEGFLADVCRDWESAAEPARRAGARVVQCRTGVVLAPNGGSLAALTPLYRLGLGGRLGDGRQYLSWISLEDEVRALAFAIIDGSLAGPVNFTGPAPVTNAQFNSALARALHRPAPWVAPRALLSLVLGEFAAEGVLAGQRAIPAKLEQAGFVFEHNTIGQALTSVFDGGRSLRV